MKRFLTGCAAALLLLLPILSLPAGAAWAEGLLVEGQQTLEGSLLAPGTTLEAPLQVLIDGNPADLTDAVLGQESLSVAATRGQELLSALSIQKRQGVYTLVAQTRAAVAEPQTVELSLRRSLNGAEQAACTLSFRVGYDSPDSAALDSLTEGEAIPVEQQTPLFTAAQLLALARQNGGEPLTFVGEGWQLRGLPDTDRALCLLYSTDPIDAVESQLGGGDRALAYASFPAGATLAQAGSLTLDVSGLEGFGGSFYVYRYAYGRLYRFPARYDAEAGSLTIQTAVLGRFVLTNQPLAEGTVVGSAADPAEKNPDTGDLSPVGGVAALALGAAGVLLFCRKRAH